MSKLNTLLFLFLFLFKSNAQFIHSIHTSIFPTFTEIKENGDIILVQSTTFDSIEILDYVFYPKTLIKPNGGRYRELYITQIDTNLEIRDHLHFYGPDGIRIIGSYLFENEYYLLVESFDTIYYKDTFFTNHLNLISPTFLFKYDFNQKTLKLCKLIGGGFEFSNMYVSEKCVYIALQFVDTAVVDSFILAPLRSSIHQRDILILKLEKETNSIAAITSVLGHEASYPIKIFSSKNGNIYLSLDTYGRFLKTGTDSIVYPRSGNGIGLALRFSENLKLTGYITTSGLFTDIFVDANNSTNLSGIYFGNLFINNTQYSSSLVNESAFVAKFDENLYLSDYLEYEGNGSRRFKILSNSIRNEYLLAGHFTKTIKDGSNSEVESKGAYDAFLYFIDTSNSFSKALYFKGDSNEYIDNIMLLDNNDILVLGRTYSEKVVCGTDSLISNWDSPLTRVNYFLYRINKVFFNHINENDIIENYLDLMIDHSTGTIKLNIKSSEILSIRIFNNDGQVFYHKGNLQLDQSLEFNSNLTSGVYFLTINMRNGNLFTKRIMMFK
ncbi:MAG: T9SS type A sorting domain-containing protein [Saprospiraceae bacterium]|nr:T9SS type A sorting domain-containing protein [Saprospiraceae bacterium]